MAAAADKFSDEYNVQHRRRNTVDPASRLCITTIQRLSSMLKGGEKYDEANEEGSLFELGPFVVPPSGGYNAEESIRRSNAKWHCWNDDVQRGGIGSVVARRSKWADRDRRL